MTVMNGEDPALPEPLTEAEEAIANTMAMPVKLTLAECNWTCARASRCHEYECDGESHFVPKEHVPNK